MGRLFVTNLQGPAYQCRYCQRVDIAAYVDPINRIPPQFQYQDENVGKLYYFSKCFNVVIATDEATIVVNGQIDKSMPEVFCIACNSHIGYYYESGRMYNEGNFHINRFKLHGPPEGSDDDEEVEGVIEE